MKSYKERLNTLHSEAAGKLVYLAKEGSKQVACEVELNGKRYGGYLPELKYN